MRRNGIAKNLASVDVNNIKRGNIYWAIFPYTQRRPLNIFMPTKKNSGVKSIEKITTFKGTIDGNGIRHSDEVQVIVTHKRRMVISLDSDDSNDTHYTHVIPITTHSGNQGEMPDEAFMYDARLHYLGKLTGKHSIADISDIKKIDRRFLLSSTKFSVPCDVMQIIEKKLATLLAISKIPKCEKCHENLYNLISKVVDVHGVNEEIVDNVIATTLD